MNIQEVLKNAETNKNKALIVLFGAMCATALFLPGCGSPSIDLSKSDLNAELFSNNDDYNDYLYLSRILTSKEDNDLTPADKKELREKAINNALRALKHTVAEAIQKYNEGKCLLEEDNVVNEDEISLNIPTTPEDPVSITIGGVAIVDLPPNLVGAIYYIGNMQWLSDNGNDWSVEELRKNYAGCIGYVGYVGDNKELSVGEGLFGGKRITEI